MHQRGPIRRREREKGLKKICEEIIAENFPNMGKEIVNEVQERVESPRQDKPKEVYPRRINPRRYFGDCIHQYT